MIVFKPFNRAVLGLSLLLGMLGSASAQTPPPLVMDISGTPALGEYVTMAFKDGEQPVGEYFDIWICGEEAILDGRRPDDLLSDESNAGCTPLNFWLRSPDTVTAIKFLMTDEGYDPVEEIFAFVDVLNPADDTVIQAASQEDETGINGADYCALQGPMFDRLLQRIEPPYYLITHDYPGGGHSNALGPFSCPEVSSIPTNSSKGLVVLVVLTLLSTLLVFRGRMS